MVADKKPDAPGRAANPAELGDGGDAELAQRAVAGDITAFDALVARYATRIFSHLHRLVRDREEAEDLAQETFIRAYRFLDTYDVRRPLRSWLYTIATNVGLNALRARRRRIPAGETVDPDCGWEPVDPREDVRQSAMRAELVTRMDAAVNRLPAHSAALIQLYYREGLSLAEASEILGISEAAAKVALFRARQRLRQMLLEDHEE